MVRRNTEKGRYTSPEVFEQGYPSLSNSEGDRWRNSRYKKKLWIRGS